MNFWITTHWPPREGDTRPVGSGIYVPHNRQDAARDLTAGDIVLIYQAQGGKTLLRQGVDGQLHKLRCAPGKGGIVAISRARSGVSWDKDAEVESYTDSTMIHWAWHAPLDVISYSGFVPRKELNRILGYSDNYVFHGFGDLNSGLKKIDEATYLEIEAAFRAGRPADEPALSIEPRPGGTPGGEGEPHRLLKEFVAAAPAVVLREEGLVLTKIEHVFPTGDRADIVLRDRFGRVLGVEIEVHVGNLDFAGFLQALKYAVMLEPLYNRLPGDSRAVLVAYSITPQMRDLCARYSVECYEVAEADVLGWHSRDLPLVLPNGGRPAGPGA